MKLDFQHFLYYTKDFNLYEMIGTLQLLGISLKEAQKDPTLLEEEAVERKFDELSKKQKRKLLKILRTAAKEYRKDKKESVIEEEVVEKEGQSLISPTGAADPSKLSIIGDYVDGDAA